MGLRATLIESPRLRLEPLEVAHAAEMVAVLAHASLYEFTGGSPPTRPELEQRYRSQVAGSGDPTELWCNWILRLTDLDTSPDSGPDRGPVVGSVQATVYGERAEVAWLVGYDHQRRGLGQEAAQAMGRWLGSVGVRELAAHIHPDHVASHRVAAALGLADSGEADDEGEQIWRGPSPRGGR